MAMMDAGLTATLSREFASSNNSTSDKLRTYKTLESCYFIISVFVIILLLSASGLIAFNWLNLDNIPPERVSFYLKIISVEIGLRLLGHFYSGGFIGLEKQVKSNMYQVGYGAVRNGLVLVPILFYPSLQLFFIWQAITTFLYVIIIRFDLSFTLTHSIQLFFTKPRIEKQVLSKIWRFAGGMMLISMVAGLNSQMDKLALSKLLPIEVLGLYTLAFALSKGLSFISSPVSTAILPRMTALFTAGKKEEATRVFNIGYLFVSIVIFSFAAAMVFFAKELIWVWTNNNELAEKAHIYVPWIAAGTSFLALQNLPFNVAIANGYTRFNNILGLSSLIITLPGYWILTKLFGGIGAAITYSFVQIFIGIVFIYLVNRRFMQLNAKTLYLKNFVLPIIISAGITLVLYNFISFEGNRLIVLLKIGFVVGCSLMANTIILVPHKKLIVEFNKIKNFKKIA
jgi:O-antigen/teichoic acid export membrane protein